MQRGLGEAAPPKAVSAMSECRGFPHSRFASRREQGAGSREKGSGKSEVGKTNVYLTTAINAIFDYLLMESLMNVARYYG
ncbi:MULTISPECIES: hypothetical protein [Moorena]|uniref:Uncharacterized protein n=1 Tax=Moorena producens 3L TaxID=489825 RepID=F4XQD3_9CYAN|nr:MULTISPECIES: hypothetical protein [Moorena]EGJ33200.1 hypothetical protein LYNGBM3L_44080 [Moorena producens 3L]OLT64849.1 hypothetical protein BI334_07230 [Moorena producens 3L]